MHQILWGATAAILLVGSCTALTGLDKEYDLADRDGGVDAGSVPVSAQASSSGQDGEGGAGIGGTAGSGGTGSAPSTNCPDSGKGPDMVKVPGADGNDYCIDSTEVTVGHYDEWLITGPPVSDQIDICLWNSTYQLNTNENDCEYFHYDEVLSIHPNGPIVCVDWCDAYAFCQWAGKRLCGKLGGGTNDSESAIDPTASQWYRACSEGGVRNFPYGDMYDATKCVGVGFDSDPAFDGSKDYPHTANETKSCEGGYPGIFNMSGNVWELEDSCDKSLGKDDSCLIRSGSYKDGEMDLTCSSLRSQSRHTAAISTSFRCCADLN